MRDEVADGFWDAGNGAGDRCCEVGGDFFEGAGERFEFPIELNAHLEGECVAGRVVGAIGWAAGVGEVVGVILRLEHVEDVRAEGLRAEDDVGVLGVVFACDGKVGCGLLDFDAALQEGVDEFSGGGEVGLIGREDVAARVAHGRIVENFFVEA